MDDSRGAEGDSSSQSKDVSVSSGIENLEEQRRMDTRGVSRARGPGGQALGKTRSDRAYLNYLIGISGLETETLEQRYHQWFSTHEGENDAVKAIQLCIQVLVAHLAEVGKTPARRDDWISETGDISDHGYLWYLLSEETRSQDEEIISRAAHALGEAYKINLLVDPTKVTTRARQCIRTLQAILREQGITFDYRGQWVQRLDQADFPENFLQVKQRLISGDVESLRKQLDDCSEILANCYIRRPNQTAVKFSEAGESEYARIYQGMQRGIDLIKEMIEIDDLMAAGHRHFYDEAYQWAIARYFAAYEQIQKILRSLSGGLHLTAGLDIGYPLEAVAEQIDSFFRNLEFPDANTSEETLRFRFGYAPKEQDLHGGDEISSTHGPWRIVDEDPFASPFEPFRESHWYHAWDLSQGNPATVNKDDWANKEWPNRRRGTFLYFPGGADWKDYRIRIERLTWSRKGGGDFGVMFRFSAPPNGLYYRLSLSQDNDGCVYLIKGGRPLNWDENWKNHDYILLPPTESPETPNLALPCGIVDRGHDLWWKLEIQVAADKIQATITPRGPGFPDSCRLPDGSYPSLSCTWEDHDFIPSGTIALYSYGMFCRWSDVYVTHRQEESILHSNPFQVSAPNDAPQYLCQLPYSNYSDRLAENLTIQSLEDLVSIQAEGYPLVDYGVGEGCDDAIGDFQIIYHKGDNKVNRLALAQLLVTLPSTIPHYCFYVLPIALGDCHREIGDFGRAKAYYNLVYQPAGLVQHIRASEFEPVQGEWDLENTDRVIKKEGPWSERDHVTAGSRQWSDYVLEVEARKLHGHHGFLIFLRYAAADDWLCWDVGRSVIESNQGGTVVELETSADASPDVVHRRWYKIQVVARGRKIACSIDGASLTCELPPDSPHHGGCIGLGASRTVVEYRDVRLTLLQEEAIYPYLNPSTEIPLMRMRLAQNHIDWGDSLYRQQDDESIDLAKEMYGTALCVHEAKDWCEQDLYGSMERAVAALMEAESSLYEPQILARTITAMEDLRQGQDRPVVKDIYKEVASLVTVDVAQEGMKEVMVALASTLGWDYADFWRRTGVVTGPVSGIVERALPNGGRTDQLAGPVYALPPRKTGTGSDIPGTGMAPYGHPHPLPKRPPENPLVLGQKRTACLRIYAIEQGLNRLGYRDNYLSIFRYAYLAEQAKAFASLALSAEREFLSFREKFERESLTGLQARQALAMALAAVQLEELRRIEATDRLAASRMQVNQIYAQMNELEAKLADIDWLDYVLAAAQGAAPLVKKIFASGDKKKETQASERTEFDRLVKDDGRTSNGAERAAQAAGLPAFASSAAVAVEAGIGVIKGISSVEGQKSALEGQLERLGTQDLPLARQNMGVAKDRLMIAAMQKDIAILRSGFAQDILEFLKGKFLNVEMWSHLARSMREIYELYLEYATTLAWLAERALEFERSIEINRIRFNYYSAEKQGLLAAENLIKDMASLEYDRLVSETKKSPIKQVISLAQRYPYQFAELRRSGQSAFYLPLELFDLLYPGLYQARLKGVELVLVGDLPPSGMQGRLTNLGASRIRVLDIQSEGRKFIETGIHSPPETVTLSAYEVKADQAMFRPSQADGTLRPFEGLGVDSYWMLDFGQAFADLGLSQVMDVQIVLYFTAEYDEDLRQAVLEAQPPVQTQIQPFSLKLMDQDAYDAFVRPEQVGCQDRGMRLLSFLTGADDFPPNQTWRRLKNLFIHFRGQGGAAAPLSVHLFSERHPETVSATSDAVGLIASNVGADDAAIGDEPLNAFSGLLPTDRWGLKVLPEENSDWQQKNAVGRPISSLGNGFLRLSGSSGSARPPVAGDEWPADLCCSAKVRLHKGGFQFELRGGAANLAIGPAGMVLSSEGSESAKDALLDPQSWYALDILLIQDIAKVFVDGMEWLEGEVGHAAEGAFAVHLSHGDTKVDLDDLRIQQVDPFALPLRVLFEQCFSLQDRENVWTLEGDDIHCQIEEETTTVNPCLDLSELEDILLLLEYEYGRPGPPLLHIQPDTLDFGKVLVGKPAMLETQLFNNGGDELIVTELVGHLPDDFKLSVRDGNVEGLPFVLSPGQFLTLSVTFAPELRGVQEGLILVTTSENAIGGGNDRRRILVCGQGVGPAFSTVPGDELDFHEVPIGDSSFPGPGNRAIQIRNPGERLLEVTLAELTGEEFHTTMIVGRAVTVEPKGRQSIPVVFVPREPTESVGALHLKSNDRNRPEVKIRLVGRGKSWLSASPLELFARLPVDHLEPPGILTTEITNETIHACEIQKVSVDQQQAEAEFKVMAPDEAPFRLMPDESFPLKISAKPRALGEQRASVEILFSKEEEPGPGPIPDGGRNLSFSVPLVVIGS